jgi:hypothetical protein
MLKTLIGSSLYNGNQIAELHIFMTQCLSYVTEIYSQFVDKISVIVDVEKNEHEEKEEEKKKKKMMMTKKKTKTKKKKKTTTKKKKHHSVLKTVNCLLA